jgi:hypothetical protein
VLAVVIQRRLRLLVELRQRSAHSAAAGQHTAGASSGPEHQLVRDGPHPGQAVDALVNQADLLVPADLADTRAVGSPAVMREQLDKLAGLAREPGVVIQILPFTASDHPGTDGPILVYDFDGASSVAYTECNGGGRIVESADEVGDLMMIVNMIRAAALPPRESARLIQQIRSELADA